MNISFPSEKGKKFYKFRLLFRIHRERSKSENKIFHVSSFVYSFLNLKTIVVFQNMDSKRNLDKLDFQNTD